MSEKANSRAYSILLAAAIAVAFVAWILSGNLSGGTVQTGEPATGKETVMRVTVRRSTARETTRTIAVNARTEPDRAVEIKAETEGRVVAVGAERGSVVAAGQALVELDIRDRRSRLAEAEAMIRQRELEFDAAEQLRGQQFISPAEYAAREAQLVAARAARDRIQLEIDRTRIQAPFEAQVYDRLVEVGDYVAVGDPIAQLVDADPLIVVGNINERDVGALAVGASGRASVLGDLVREGTIRYVAPSADESTRSFRVELAIPNGDRALRAGTSARLLLTAEKITAHEISPGIIWLADDGTIGVKIVDSADRVRFVPVEIAESTSDSVLVTGLPLEATIITVGQGFVTDGQPVIPQQARPAALTRAPNERPY